MSGCYTDRDAGCLRVCLVTFCDTDVGAQVNIRARSEGLRGDLEFRLVCGDCGLCW